MAKFDISETKKWIKKPVLWKNMVYFQITNFLWSKFKLDYQYDVIILDQNKLDLHLISLNDNMILGYKMYVFT